MKTLIFAFCLFVAGSAMAYAQATAAINGRVVDQADAVVPNATVIVTNLGTGVARESVTNGEGLYNVPALTPGNYDVKVQIKGFDTADRSNVELLTGANLSVDFKMQVGAVQQTVEVGAQAALVETSQAVGSSSIRQAEVDSLPMLNRSMGALMALMPGARELTVTGSTISANYISIGGGTGHNFNMVVDGIDNQEHNTGGTLIEYSLEGVQEFKTLTNGANAEYGRGTGQVLLTTKSGTNQVHGSAFGYFRNDSLVRTDYFSLAANGGAGIKPPFSRNQEGGSIGGPIIKDKAFFFGSVERVSQTFSLPRSQTILDQLNFLVPLNIGVLVTPTIAEPSSNLLTQGKISYLLNSKHSAFLRYAGENLHTQNFLAQNFALLDYAPYQSKSHIHMFDISLGETYVVNPTSVNQFTAQWISYSLNTHYPPCPLNIPTLGVDSCLGRDLTFPSVSTAVGNSFPDYFIWVRQYQFKDDFSKQMGRHSLKFGADVAYLPLFGGLFANVTPGTIGFFADPGTIVNNTNGQYPGGFSTPGVVRSVLEYPGEVGILAVPNNYMVAFYGQDDYKMTPRLTLNLGLRWDVADLGWDTPADQATNPTYKILKTIGSPYGQLPKVPSMKDFQPRIGFAWDVGGNGKDVVRVSYGLFYLTQEKLTNYQQDVYQKPIVDAPQSLINTAVGVGPLATVILSPIVGASPLPPIQLKQTFFPTGQNTQGIWYDPNNMKDTGIEQFHGGWSHIFASNKDVVSVDYTAMFMHHGFRAMDINPLLPIGGGQFARPLAALTQKFYGDPKLLGPVFLESANMRATYKETAVHYEHRFTGKASFQLNYVLAWSKGTGGNGDGAQASVGSVLYPQFASPQGGNLTAPWEFGPTNVDERSRITATGLFTLPFKIELSPSVTWATARPYTLYRGTNPSGDGNLQVLKSDGVTPIGIDTQRGAALFMVNTRVTKNIPFGKDGRFVVSAFAELYNLTNRANFGNVYGGFAPTTATFEKPTGYLGGAGAVSTIPNSFQVQFGGRFTF